MTPEEFQQATEEFKIIYYKVFSKELSEEEATETTLNLLQLLDLLSQETEKEVK